ncbi:MAG TPA: DUF2254 domain-containing protein [Nocardioides sp.]|nr:DUF2254 domain-containing protein [Nocardioides sp.]
MTTSRPAPSPAPTPDRAHRPDLLRRWGRRAFSRFWVLPALWCTVAVAAGVLIPVADENAASWMPFLFEGGIDGARTVLSTIAGAMISVTGLVFSITIVVLQLASSQFSPRVLPAFLDDRITQNTLGVFAATFLYSLTVLRSVGSGPGTDVPQLGVTIGFGLVLAAVGMFLAFIHRITRTISVTTVIREVAADTRRLLARSSGAGPAESGDTLHLRRQSVATAPTSGYLDTLDQRALVALARRHDLHLEVLHPLGTFVPEGAPVVMVRGAGPVAGIDGSVLVRNGLGIAPERTMQQDPTFGMRRLVDIAERALSPGTNDPTTATQAIDELHDLLRRLVNRPDPQPVWRDDDGVARLVTTEPTFVELLDLAVDEIAHWGADGIQTPRRLAAMLRDLAAAASDDHRETVHAKAASIDRGAH